MFLTLFIKDKVKRFGYSIKVILNCLTVAFINNLTNIASLDAKGYDLFSSTVIILIVVIPLSLAIVLAKNKKEINKK